MKHTDEHKQTAFTSVGIPTGEEGVAATDGLSEAVEAMTENMEKEATGEVDSEQHQSKSK